mmetsp:Transcript_34754/g.93073  ORF Transcript_34754/g.93073 Transcript_34754/m.93073 type:complete len:325 (-) Transcript_34754:84-1058(-)
MVDQGRNAPALSAAGAVAQQVPSGATIRKCRSKPPGRIADRLELQGRQLALGTGLGKPEHVLMRQRGHLDARHSPRLGQGVGVVTRLDLDHRRATQQSHPLGVVLELPHQRGGAAISPRELRAGGLLLRRALGGDARADEERSGLFRVQRFHVGAVRPLGVAAGVLAPRQELLQQGVHGLPAAGHAHLLPAAVHLEARGAHEEVALLLPVVPDAEPRGVRPGRRLSRPRGRQDLHAPLGVEHPPRPPTVGLLAFARCLDTGKTGCVPPLTLADHLLHLFFGKGAFPIHLFSLGPVPQRRIEPLRLLFAQVGLEDGSEEKLCVRT